MSYPAVSNVWTDQRQVIDDGLGNSQRWVPNQFWECATSADLALINVTIAAEKDWAFVADFGSLYQLIGGVWVLRFSRSPSDVILAITIDGRHIDPGTSVLQVGADSSHEITTPMTPGVQMKVYQDQLFTATLYLPSGWNFSDGNKTLLLGYKANCSLNYYGGNVVVIEYNTPGVTS